MAHVKCVREIVTGGDQKKGSVLHREGISDRIHPGKSWRHAGALQEDMGRWWFQLEWDGVILGGMGQKLPLPSAGRQACGAAVLSCKPLSHRVTPGQVGDSVEFISQFPMDTLLSLSTILPW